MEDLTLKSDLFNNVKFNMQKLILDVPEKDAGWLAAIFQTPVQEVEALLQGFEESVAEQAESLSAKMDIPGVGSECTVAFIGDSITSDRTSYFNIIRKLYEKEEKIHFVDAAISGHKSDDSVMGFYVKTMKYQPDVVHILIGTNDLRHNDDTYGHSCVSLEEYRRNVAYLLKTLQEKEIPVIISQISPVDNVGLKKRFPEDNWCYDKAEIAALNVCVRELAEQYGAKLNPMEEIYGQYAPEELLFEDGLHLNEKGQLLLAEQVLKCLGEYI